MAAKGTVYTIHTEKCLREGTLCGVFLRIGHYDRVCIVNKSHENKPKKKGVVRTQPLELALLSAEEVSHIRRVDSTTRPLPNLFPPLPS